MKDLISYNTNKYIENIQRRHMIIVKTIIMILMKIYFMNFFKTQLTEQNKTICLYQLEFIY